MFDVIVIGGGQAGVTAALRARELGAMVALVERGKMGGTCTNDGCVPTRALARAARLVRDAEQFVDFGLVGEKPAVDFAALLSRTRNIVSRVHEKKHLQSHLEQEGVTVFANVGDARFIDEHSVALGDRTILQGEKFILCVGGHARRLSFPGSEHALTHSDVWSMQRLPHQVVVVGGAATGCQLSSCFSAFGAYVHVLEVAPRLLAGEDEAVSDGISEAFQRRGIAVTTNIGGIERIEQQNGSLRLTYLYEGEVRQLTTEAVVMTVGWPGKVEALNLALIDGHREGFCKLIVSTERRRVLGAHIMGEQAVEVLQLVATCMAADMRIEQLADLELAYPTFTAIVGLAARRLSRELGVIPLSPQGQTQSRMGIAEWERGEA